MVFASAPLRYRFSVPLFTTMTRCDHEPVGIGRIESAVEPLRARPQHRVLRGAGSARHQADPARIGGPAEERGRELRGGGGIQPQRNRVAAVVDEVVRQAHAGAAVEQQRTTHGAAGIRHAAAGLEHAVAGRSHPAHGMPEASAGCPRTRYAATGTGGASDFTRNREAARRDLALERHRGRERDIHVRLVAAPGRVTLPRSLSTAGFEDTQLIGAGIGAGARQLRGLRAPR